MSPDRDAVRLRHMLDHARGAVTLAAGRSPADLATDRTLELSLVRLVEVIGDSAARVSDARRARHPDVQWRVIVGMRHHLVHGYDTISLDVLWETVKQDLPRLIAQLEAALGGAAD
jgi:uncharacterized protein with HEPN domain